MHCSLGTVPSLVTWRWWDRCGARIQLHPTNCEMQYQDPFKTRVDQNNQLYHELRKPVKFDEFCNNSFYRSTIVYLSWCIYCEIWSQLAPRGVLRGGNPIWIIIKPWGMQSLCSRNYCQIHLVPENCRIPHRPDNFCRVWILGVLQRSILWSPYILSNPNQRAARGLLWAQDPSHTPHPSTS